MRTIRITDDVAKKMDEIAQQRGTTARQVLINIIKIGLVAYAIDEDPERRLVIREPGQGDFHR